MSRSLDDRTLQQREIVDSGPIPLDGCVGWYEAQTLADSLASGADVPVWPDISGNGNDATQGTTANQPHFITGAANGLPVVRFNGTNNEFLTLPNIWSGASSAEGFFVQRCNNAAAPDNARAGWCLMGSGSQSHYPFSDGNIYLGFAANRQSLGTFGSLTKTNLHLANFSNRSTYWLGASNGRWWHALMGVATFTVPSAPVIGRSDATYRFDGDMALVLLYNRVLSTAERGRVHSYITDRYAISLP